VASLGLGQQRTLIQGTDKCSTMNGASCHNFDVSHACYFQKHRLLSYIKKNMLLATISMLVTPAASKNTDY